MLREAGKTDMPRLERYLRANGAAIPRTTLRYAIERFPEAKRRALLLRRTATSGLRRSEAQAAQADSRVARAEQGLTMGAEATVTARFKGMTATGKARLETEVLQFRGGDLKLSIPFKQMSKVAARGGTLSVTFAGRHRVVRPRRRGARNGRTRSCTRRRGCRRSASKPEWRASAIGVAGYGVPEGARSARVAHALDRPRRQGRATRSSSA